MLPSRRHFLALLGAAACSRAAAQAPNPATGLKTVTHKALAMGIDISLTVLHRQQDVAEKAIEAALAQVQRVDQLMSLYRPDSQIRTLNRTGVLDRPDPLLVDIIQTSLHMSRRTQGAFDITVQPLWELYAAAKKEGTLPSPQAIRDARAKVDWQKVEVSDTRLAFKDPGMAITLNAIAQGYAADLALAALRHHGITQALVNTGEIGALGRRADGQPWTVGIQHPRAPDAYVALAQLEDRCLATSGDYATTFTDDRAYHHIFDPATGRSPTTFSSVTVVSPSGADADALATAIFVIGYDQGVKLLEDFKNTQAMFVWKDGRVATTKGFPQA
jgi:thiamine biosynthesis lipoprotein